MSSMTMWKVVRIEDGVARNYAGMGVQAVHGDGSRSTRSPCRRYSKADVGELLRRESRTYTAAVLPLPTILSFLRSVNLTHRGADAPPQPHCALLQQAVRRHVQLQRRLAERQTAHRRRQRAFVYRLLGRGHGAQPLVDAQARQPEDPRFWRVEWREARSPQVATRAQTGSKHEAFASRKVHRVHRIVCRRA